MTRAPAHLFQRQAIDHDQVMAMLAKVEETHRNNAWAGIAGGAALCGVSVLILTTFYFLITFAWIVSFKVTYLVVGVVCLPGLFWVAHKLKGSILEATVPGSDLLQTRIVGRRVIPLLVVAEMANIGPRLVLWGVSQIRGRTAFGAIPPERVGAAVATLMAADAGISPAKLIQPGETADQLEPLLGVLLYYELADISKNADKVWITTEAKKKMGRPV